MHSIVWCNFAPCMHHAVVVVVAVVVIVAFVVILVVMIVVVFVVIVVIVAIKCCICCFCCRSCCCCLMNSCCCRCRFRRACLSCCYRCHYHYFYHCHCYCHCRCLYTTVACIPNLSTWFLVLPHFSRPQHYMKEFPGKSLQLSIGQLISVAGLTGIWCAVASGGHMPDFR